MSETNDSLFVLDATVDDLPPHRRAMALHCHEVHDDDFAVHTNCAECARLLAAYP